MLNEEKITYRMKTLMESGFFGTKSLLSEAFADKDKVRLFQAAYNYTYDKNIAVDGIKGTQTNAAIEDVKKQLGIAKLDDAGTKDFYQKFLLKLDESKGSINVGQGGTNTNKVLNYAIQTLINLAGTPLGIDGVVGTKTLAAIKTVTEDSEVINAENITTITRKAIKYILELGVEDIPTVQSTSASADAGTDAGADDATKTKNTAESEEKWKNYPCITQAGGIKKEIRDDGTISYVDKDNKNRYFDNGRKGNFDSGQMDNFYCLKGQVMIGSDSDYTGGTKSKFGNCITGNCENGIGKLRNTEGNIYIGTFKNFYLTGKDNEIRRINGDIFKGETLNGFPVYGTYYYKVGTTYTGKFKPKSFDPDEPIEQMAENILNVKRGKNNI